MSRHMRMMLMFDLPTQTPKDRKTYTRFRKALLNDGFDMMQFSIYTRLCPNNDQADKHFRRVRDYAPETGSVRMLTVTNKQYGDMAILAGSKTVGERYLGEQNLTLF